MRDWTSDEEEVAALMEAGRRGVSRLPVVDILPGPGLPHSPYLTVNRKILIRHFLNELTEW